MDTILSREVLSRRDLPQSSYVKTRWEETEIRNLKTAAIIPSSFVQMHIQRKDAKQNQHVNNR